MLGPLGRLVARQLVMGLRGCRTAVVKELSNTSVNRALVEFCLKPRLKILLIRSWMHYACRPSARMSAGLTLAPLSQALQQQGTRPGATRIDVAARRGLRETNGAVSRRRLCGVLRLRRSVGRLRPSWVERVSARRPAIVGRSRLRFYWLQFLFEEFLKPSLFINKNSIIIVAWSFEL